MADKPPLETGCPTCGGRVVWGPEAHWRPFCSERCRLIDLGQWLTEGHRIEDASDHDDPGNPFDPADPEQL